MENLNFKTIIHFHGMLLTVLEKDGKEYVPLKPIVEMLGTQWKTAREKAFSGDNAELYGTCELNEPIFNTKNTPRGTKKSVFIELEATEAFLMRTNTNQIRRHGQESVANYLLALQKEWKKALHDYETKGIAMKANATSHQLINDLSKIDKMQNAKLKQIAAKQLNEDYGIEIPLANQGGLDV